MEVIGQVLPAHWQISSAYCIAFVGPPHEISVLRTTVASGIVGRCESQSEEVLQLISPTGGSYSTRIGSLSTTNDGKYRECHYANHHSNIIGYWYVVIWTNSSEKEGWIGWLFESGGAWFSIERREGSFWRHGILARAFTGLANIVKNVFWLDINPWYVSWARESF